MLLGLQLLIQVAPMSHSKISVSPACGGVGAFEGIARPLLSRIEQKGNVPSSSLLPSYQYSRPSAPVDMLLGLQLLIQVAPMSHGKFSVPPACGGVRAFEGIARPLLSRIEQNKMFQARHYYSNTGNLGLPHLWICCWGSSC